MQTTTLDINSLPYPSQTQTNEEQPSNSYDILSNSLPQTKLTFLSSTIHHLTNYITFLNRKRHPSQLSCRSLSTQDNLRYSTLYKDFKHNIDILNSFTNDYISNSSTVTADIDPSSVYKPSGKKYIGITADDIYSIPKYKPNFMKLPKYGKIVDSNRNKELNGIGSSLGRNQEGKLIMKKKSTNYSCFERQNREALSKINQKRQSYKHLDMSEKEKIDNTYLRNSWKELAKHEVPRFPKVYQKAKNEMEGITKRIATLIQKEIKKKINRVQRAQKEFNVRAKKLQKEMLVFWRKRDKEILDNKRKKDKIEIDKKKKEDELHEQIIQKKRMEFLLKQSDLYSIMMYKHLGAYMPQEDQELMNNKEHAQEQEDNNNNTDINMDNNNTVMNNNNNMQCQPQQQLQDPNYKQEIVAGKSVLVNTKTNKILFQSIRVDIDEKQAKQNVLNLIDKQRQKAQEFDKDMNKIRKTLGGDEVAIPELVPETQIERLDRPTINNSSSQLIEVPKNFNGELKEYQLKGLRWLDNLYEQGINGILADEMGLGKTIQAIAFLSHLSGEKDNWGPFLVIAPNATLYNWKQEFDRFCPSLRVLPYWGPLKERKTLRKFFNSSQLYVKSSAFHVCITSYQLIVSDEKVFHKVNWNYMILDEAHAIKNIASQRWNVLLSFRCRNRLLLSGTPIQNSMSELWALLHFIMPKLFDSHEQFQEWFSKDIEAHSQDKGELNKEQLQRLHKILKPFMLRRVKKDVEHEIGPKLEYEIPCEMTEKQKVLYNSIKEQLHSLSDLFMSTDSKIKSENLLNLVMQFRKVCNHPELFERNFGKVPFTFRNLVYDYGCYNTFTVTSGDVYLRTNNQSIIFCEMPKSVYDFCYEVYNVKYRIPKWAYLPWNYDYVVESLYGKNNNRSNDKSVNVNFHSLFNFVFLLGMSVSNCMSILTQDALVSHISLMHLFTTIQRKNQYYQIQNIINKRNLSLFINDYLFPYESNYSFLKHKPNNNNSLLPPLIIDDILSLKNSLPHKIVTYRCYIPKAIAFTPQLVCSNAQLSKHIKTISNSLFKNKLLYGNDFKQFYETINLKLPNKCREILHIIDQNGLMTPLFYQMEGYTQIELPSFERLISDCAKLKKLDELLRDLFSQGHRVLIFCQMTHMLDILEEYMAKRKYIYFRLDGSTNIADRRDMINEFQTNPKIFAFLLSTRAGGLGVNLTGADTVIFYDNDWNPTCDAQATDRAHRIGQTKVVSVYRLITANTIEERILKRAHQKQNVQSTVYSGGAFKAEWFKQNEFFELLLSEEDGQKKQKMELN